MPDRTPAAQNKIKYVFNAATKNIHEIEYFLHDDLWKTTRYDRHWNVESSRAAEAKICSVLLAVDYNKHAIDSNFMGSTPPSIARQAFDIVVFDAKYRTISDKLLASGRIKVWHCTAQEYDKQWAIDKGVDWVVQSAHHKPVRVFQPSYDAVQLQLAVPRMSIKRMTDTLGAGDVLSAEIANSLAATYTGGPLDLGILSHCVTKAIEASQKHVANNIKTREEQENAIQNEVPTDGSV